MTNDNIVVLVVVLGLQTSKFEPNVVIYKFESILALLVEDCYLYGLYELALHVIII